MTYAFIRHGQTDWNRDGRLQGSSDIPLNVAGQAQAYEAVGELREWRWDAVVSSPLMRARETAEIVARGLGIALGPSYPDLVERSYGEAEGHNEKEALAKWPNRDYAGAESIPQVVARGTRALDQIRGDYGDRNVVIVCHGTIIRYTLAALAGRKLDAILNGSVSTFEFENGAWRVLTVNNQPLSEIPAERVEHGQSESAGR